jgi:hypothetical protein
MAGFEPLAYAPEADAMTTVPHRQGHCMHVCLLPSPTVKFYWTKPLQNKRIFPRTFCHFGQGCQIVYFQTENPNLSVFLRISECKMLVYFMAIKNILRPFGIFCNKFGIYFPFWRVVPRKIWQPSFRVALHLYSDVIKMLKRLRSCLLRLTIMDLNVAPRSKWGWISKLLITRNQPPAGKRLHSSDPGCRLGHLNVY